MGTLPKSGSLTFDVDATPEQIWPVLTDITRAGEWSHENRGGEWLDGATAAVPGARFRGRNRSGRARWSRVCEVLTADAPEVISWRTVPSLLYPDSTRWTYELAPIEGGCRITQRFEVLKINPIADRLFYAFIPAHRDRSAALADDIRKLGAVARGSKQQPSRG
jgi:hypothetical protein